MDWRLCLVADADAAAGRNLINLSVEAVEAGVTLVQLRAKQLEGGLFLSLAERLSAELNRKKTPLIINDRVNVAAVCRCQGVHLGQNDLPVSKARSILGPDALIGVSVNTAEEAAAAAREGADYVGAGPVFPSGSKETALPVLGISGLSEIKKAVDIPVLAIGGIHSGNARRVFEAGVDGIAVISAILSQSDIQSATRTLVQTLPQAD